jgi:hypothetical protein
MMLSTATIGLFACLAASESLSAATPTRPAGQVAADTAETSPAGMLGDALPEAPTTQPAKGVPHTRPAGGLYSIEAEGITLCSRSPVPENAASLLKTIKSRVTTSPLYRPGDRFSISICNDRRLYAILSPRSPASFAVSRPLVGGMMIAEADLEKNIARSSAEEYNQRTFTGVATHEIAHILMKRQFGLLAKPPRWLTEGYCDYLAGESSFPEVKGDRLLAAGEAHPSGSFFCFTSRRMVEYLIDDQNRNIEDLLRHPPDEQEVKAETEAWIKRRLERPSATNPADSSISPSSRSAP